jgi:hypothetical protein
VSKTVALTWGYVITTNATRRTVALVVEGPGGVDYYKLAPGGAASTSKNYIETVQAPEDAGGKSQLNHIQTEGLPNANAAQSDGKRHL